MDAKDAKGPAPKRKLITVQPPTVPLSSLPLSSSYTTSYMHRAPLVSVLPSTKSGMLLTASSDGVVKFWKRTGDAKGVEYVKSFKAHVGSIVSSAVYRQWHK